MSSAAITFLLWGIGVLVCANAVALAYRFGLRAGRRAEYQSWSTKAAEASFPVELVGGPADGKIVSVGGLIRTVRVPVMEKVEVAGHGESALAEYFRPPISQVVYRMERARFVTGDAK